MEVLIDVIILTLVSVIIYDRYVQRKHQLLINYPLIGRMRYVFESLREPFRQYFGDENFYESKDKVDWVYDSANNKNGYTSFSPSQPQQNPKFLIKHANAPLNDNEVEQDFGVTFGINREKPFTSKSIIGRGAMSDGAISPEGTRAFVLGAQKGNFPINTGEGSLTSNFLYSHRPNHDEKYLDIVKLNGFDKVLFSVISFFFNGYVAIKYLRMKLLDSELSDTYIFCFEQKAFFRVNWDAPAEQFPSEVPQDIPDIIFQMSSGLYGVRDKNGNFDEARYKKTMSFCKMTEIKIAQGAKQTGGKLVAAKVTPAIAYYRGVKANQNIYSPNRFPFANDVKELFDFVGRLQKLSKKPVGFKIVISDRLSFEEYVKEIKYRKENNLEGIPDFISIDGGDGGSATAPFFLMDRIGFHIKDAVHIADNLLKSYGVRDEVKLIVSSKILTPDDVIIALSLGGDYVSIARGFMLSAGCIRARMCSGEGSHNCPVGLATQNKKLRKSFLVYKQATKVANYHNKLLHGVSTMLAVMGKKSIKELSEDNLSFVDKNGFIHTNVSRYLDKKLEIN